MDEYKINFRVVRGFEDIQPIYDLLRGEGYIAGSYAAYMAVPNEPITPGDVDVFAVSMDAAHRIAMELVEWNSVVSWTENSATYTLERTAGNLPIQVVKPNPNWKTFPDDILNDFDLSVCRAVLVAPDTIYADEGIVLTAGKILRINNALRSLKRIIKYSQRGVKFNDHELIKLFRAWEQMDTQRKDHIAEVAAEEIAPVFVGAEYYTDDDWFEGE